MSPKVFPRSVNTWQSTVSSFLWLYPLLYSIVLTMTVSTSQSIICWFCFTMSTAVFYSLSEVCQYFSIYRLLVQCHFVHCCRLYSAYCLSVYHRVPSLVSVSLCTMPSSTVFPMSVSTSPWTFRCFPVTISIAVLYSRSNVCTLYSTVSWFCITVFSALFYILTNVCQYLTLYRLFTLCH